MTADAAFTLRRLSTPAAVRDELAADVQTGLTSNPKQLPPKYFYDAAGSALFEKITHLPEYYPTRAETEILDAHAADVVALTQPEEMVELGSGSSRKTRLLLEAMHDAGTGDRYVALDVSEEALREAARTLTADYGWLEVVGLIGDFHTDLGAIPRGGRRVVAFLGSTIGNLERDERAAFLGAVYQMLHGDDWLLLGVDLVKDAGTLEAAYDDAAGVTADFNRNVLRVMNRELDADFDVDAFEHVAVYDKERRRVEMRLRASREMTVRFPSLGLDVDFDAGEEMLTEISCKFVRETMEAELGAAGIEVARWMTDERERFALVVARRRDDLT